VTAENEKPEGQPAPPSGDPLPNAGRVRAKRGRKPKANGHTQEGMNGTEISGAAPGQSRARIRLEPGFDSEVIDAMEAELIRHRAPLFQWAHRIVIPARGETVRPDGRKVARLILAPAAASHIAELATRYADFERFSSHSHAWVPASFPRELAEKYVARGQWGLRGLAGIVHAPTLRHDGTILERPGYDDQTGLYFEPGETAFPPVPAHPTRDDAMAALTRVRALVSTFPFVEPIDEAVWLSGFLTALVRRSLRAAPLHAFTSPVAGSGKSMLVDISSIVATGQCAPVIVQAKGEEMEKRLVASFMAGDAVIAIDNCTMPLGGAFLCAALTQETARMRVLGKSRNIEAPSNAAVFANGNNLVTYSDAVRRVLRGRLDPKMERPETRKFDVDPLEVARRLRPQLVADGLTIIRAAHVARIPAAPPLGSFPDWSAMIRDALVWLGLPDAALTVETSRADDPDLLEHRAMLANCYAVFPPPKKFTVKQLIAAAAARDDKGELTPAAAALHDAIAAVASNKAGTGIDPRRLGNWLASKQGRLAALPDEDEGNSFSLSGPLAFRSRGTLQGVAVWAVERGEK